MAFVTANGTKFFLNGSPWFLFGCTVYNDLYWFNGTTPIATKIAQVVAAGYNTIRFTNYMNVAADANIESAEYVWAQIDYVLDQCRQNNLKVIIENTEVSGIASSRGYAVGDTNYMLVYQNFYNFLCNRVNTVNGRVYKNDDTIAMYSIAGELGEPFTASVGNRAFYTTLSGYIRANDTNHLICPGAQNPEQIYDTTYTQNGQYKSEDILTVSSIDVAATEGYYGRATEAFLYPQIGSYARSKNKPWMIMEFGFDQLYFNERQRPMEYKFIYDTGLKNNCAGFIFWNFDGGATGAGYGVNPNTPQTYKMCRTYAKTSSYSPRLLVI